MHGITQSLHTERGFGFLRDPEAIEFLFHHSALPSSDHFDTLAVGMVVEFVAEVSPKGSSATNITVVPDHRR
jgi:cold shock CspA family protein